MNTCDEGYSDKLLTIATLVGFGITVVLMYPGFMGWDSVEQLVQAREGLIADWHPPMMSKLWGWLDHIVSGPFLMLVLQNGFLWLGGYLVVRSSVAGSPVRQAFLLYMSLLFPPVLCVMGFIFKDALLAGTLLFSFGITAALATSLRTPQHSRFASLASGVFLLLGLLLASGVRYNAVGTVWGCTSFIAFCFLPGSARLLRSLFIGLLVAVVFAGVAMIMNRAFTIHRTHIWKALASFDIAGIAVTENTTAFIGDEDLGVLAGSDSAGEWSLEKLRAGYSPRDWALLPKGIVDVTASATLRDVWIKGILSYPKAYLWHRLRVFVTNLGLGGDLTNQGVELKPFQAWRKYDENGVRVLLGHDYQLSPVQKSLRDMILKLARRTPLFWPGVYLLLGLGTLPFGLRALRNGYPLPFFLVLSGVVQEAMLLFLAPGAYYRYSHWTVLSGWMAFLLLISYTYQRHRGMILAIPLRM